MVDFRGVCVFCLLAFFFCLFVFEVERKSILRDPLSSVSAG